MNFAAVEGDFEEQLFHAEASMVRSRLFLLGMLVYTVGCGFEAAPKARYESEKDTVGVIYGEDSVKDVRFAIPNSTISVALIPKDAYEKFIKKEPVETVEDSVGFLNGLKWINDPSLALCSGVLIEKDLVLTAGHCFEGPGSCADLNVVFGFESSPNV